MTAPESSEDDPAGVDPTTRLVLARLASGASRLAGEPPRAAASARARLAAFGTSLFPAPRPAGRPSRVEMGALAAALVAATFIGAAMPGSPDARAQPVATVSTPAAVAPALASAPPSGDAAAPPAATDEPAGGAEVASPSATEPLATPAVADTPVTQPATADEDAPGGAGDDDAAPGDEGDGSDPLAGSGEHLDQVALVIVHGDAPVQWAKAPAGSAGRTRADRGTTFTGLATVPGAPLATALGLVAGQAPNPATRAGCVDAAAQPLAPGTLDDLGRAAGAGCDYPAGTPSLPTAVAVDGRRWRAYAQVGQAEAAGALCGTGAPAGASAALAATSALRRLTDLTTSGACEAAAAPLSALATDLKADEPPAWLIVEVGACGAGACDAAAAADRERALDETLATLKDGLGERSAVLVVGDGTAPGLEPAPAGALPPAPDDPTAPAAVLSGALLLGSGVDAAATDPLPLDPYAIARTQADWLGLEAPGWARAEGVTGLAVPSG